MVDHLCLQCVCHLLEWANNLETVMCVMSQGSSSVNINHLTRMLSSIVSHYICSVTLITIFLWCHFVVSFCGIPQMTSLPVGLIFSSCGVPKDTTRGYPCGVLDDITSCETHFQFMWCP